MTGVAGSGKSSLMRYAFPEAYPEAIVIDQKPIGTSIRSTPATYTGVMDEIRKVFAKENGVGASWFSFNSDGGCPICRGTGQISYEMAFAEPVTVTCEECGGHRYNPTALSYRYRGLIRNCRQSSAKFCIFSSLLQSAEKLPPCLLSEFSTTCEKAMQILRLG